MDRTGLDSSLLVAAGLDWSGFTVVWIRTGLDWFKRIYFILWSVYPPRKFFFAKSGKTARVAPRNFAWLCSHQYRVSCETLTSHLLREDRLPPTRSFWMTGPQITFLYLCHRARATIPTIPRWPSILKLAGRHKVIVMYLHYVNLRFFLSVT